MKIEGLRGAVILNRDNYLSASGITTNVNSTREKSLLTRAIESLFAVAGLNRTAVTKKPLLRLVNKKKRLQENREHDNWTIGCGKIRYGSSNPRRSYLDMRTRVFI